MNQTRAVMAQFTPHINLIINISKSVGNNIRQRDVHDNDFFRKIVDTANSLIILSSNET